MLLSVEIARNEARAPAKGSQLLKRSPQCIAELLLLASRAAGDAVGRDVAAAASAAEAAAGRCHPGGELAKRRQLNLLPLARAEQHRRQARAACSTGCLVAVLLGRLPNLSCSGPELLQHCNVRLGLDGQPQVGEGTDVGHHNRRVAMHGLVQLVLPPAAGSPNVAA